MITQGFTDIKCNYIFGGGEELSALGDSGKVGKAGEVITDAAKLKKVSDTTRTVGELVEDETKIETVANKLNKAEIEIANKSAKDASMEADKINLSHSGEKGIGG